MVHSNEAKQMPLNNPLISIITVNYNQTDVTCELFRSIRENSYQNIEVFLVDNASKENPEKKVKSKYPEVNIILSDENLGFAGGNNLAIPHCNGAYIFFVNNDAELTNGCIEKLLEAFEHNNRLGIISPKICYFPEDKKQDKDILQFVGATEISNLTARNKTIGELEEDNGQFKTLSPTPYVHGAAMMASKAVIEQVGMMSEIFFLYYEELDWSERIKKAGFDIYVEPNAKIYHKESLSVGTDSPLKTYYINRNRILFMRRHKKSWQLLLFTLFLIFATIPKNTIKYVIARRWDNLKAFYKALVWNLNNKVDDMDEAPSKKLSSVIQ